MTENVKVAALGKAATNELNDGSSSAYQDTAQALDLEPGLTPDSVLVAASVVGCGWPVLTLRHHQKSPAHRAGDDADNHELFWLRTSSDVVGAALDYQRNEWERHQSIRDPNFAVVTGVSDAADHLALVALDVDGGGAALADLLAEAGTEAQDWASQTVRVAHGDPNRCHIYGLLDARPDVMLRTMPRLAEHLEFRGLGGYIALPGSVHPTGGVYTMTGGELIVNDGAQPDHGLYDGIELGDDGTVSARWRVPIPVPVGLLMTLAARGAEGVDEAPAEVSVGPALPRVPAEDEATGAMTPEHDAGDQLAHRLDRIIESVTAAAPGCGNSCLNWAAGRAAALVATHPDELGGRSDEIRQRLKAAYLARPIPTDESLHSREREALATIRSGWAWGTAHPDEALVDRRETAPAGSSVADPSLRLSDPPKIVQSEELETVSHAETAPGASEDGDALPRIPESWKPIPLSGLAALGPLLPTVGADGDGRAMLYPGRLHAVNGPAESFKSWLVLADFAVPELRRGNRVVWIDMEDEVRSMALRLSQLGLTEDEYADLLRYSSPTERMPLGPALTMWGKSLAGDGTPPTLLVVDGMTAFLTLYGGETNDADDMASLIVGFFSRVARQTGAAVCWIDHKAKAAESGRYALGSVAKMTMVSGAVFDVHRPAGAPAPRIDGTGYLHVRITKDRPGQLVRRCPPLSDDERFPLYGTAVVDSSGDGFGDVSVNLMCGTPSITPGPDEADRQNVVLDLLRSLGVEGRGKRQCWEALSAEKKRRDHDKSADPIPGWMTRSMVRKVIDDADHRGEWGQS